MENYIFFSPGKKEALKRLRDISKTDKYYVGRVPRLARKQISHGAGWKTFVAVKKRKR